MATPSTDANRKRRLTRLAILALAGAPLAAIAGLVWKLMFPSRRKALDIAVLGVAGYVGFVVAVAVLVWVIFLVRRRRANRRIHAAQPAAPIGHTTDGQPIYPVVGYTPDGKPVTADRAVGVRPQVSGTNGLAIASLILAFVVAPVGVILGFVARSQIARTGQQGSGLALAGIIIGSLFTVVNIVALIALSAH